MSRERLVENNRADLCPVNLSLSVGGRELELGDEPKNWQWTYVSIVVSAI